ncbi:TPA: hypothetical protein DCG29_01355, partial [Candidatus Nomurabacteria bacterium]|nr:hypothetical protein [Candidatus Nomurabacteria bacterium]
FDYNATQSSKTVSLPWPVVDMDGVKHTGNITIDPYRSVIYLKDPNPTPEPEIITPPITPPATPSGGGGGGGGSSSTPSTPSLTETQLKAKSKDIKQDGHLNIIDFNIIMANWNKAYTTNSLSKGDMTGDGKIDIFDINQLMVYWDVKYTV